MDSKKHPLELQHFVTSALKAVSGKNHEGFGRRELHQVLESNWQYYMARREIFWQSRLPYRIVMFFQRILNCFQSKATRTRLESQVRAVILKQIQEQVLPYKPKIVLSRKVLIFGPKEIFSTIEELSKTELVEIHGEGLGTVYIPAAKLWEVST